MRKLALLLLLSGSANAAVEGSVYAKPSNTLGWVNQPTRIACNHGGYVKNNTDKQVKVFITYSVCASEKNCDKREFSWTLQPGQEWTHFDVRAVNHVYKFSGNYTFSCYTSVSQVGQEYVTGSAQIS